MIKTSLDDAELTAGLARIKAHVTDMSDLMQDLGELLTDSTKSRFAEGAAPDGTPWAPKSQTTIDGYQQREKKARVDFRPLFGPTGRLSSEVFYQAGTTSMEIGSALIYSAVQQFGAGKGQFGTAANGSSIPWGDIPARPFIGLSDEERANVNAEILEYLARITAA
ncbi:MULTISPECIES: phage virion morphogenesis protein [Marinovum]|uniref:phage virion morphogenesis protein n=1 Tax=Marinovum TaxID=367771 RepID=UPI00065B305F|nr:phage virion morphogenesis protein [Marinovum sp. PR37]AKO97616.1 Mu-like prophage protein gpG [Marinovum algicola DG 898]MDD9744277.1 phage virion morphogenesis protein [Marinovum sp. PR37]